MRHADEDLADPGLARFGNHLVEHGHEHVEPFNREPGLAGKGPLQETFECLDLRQPVEHLDRIDRIGRGPEAAALRRLAQPVAFVRDEHVRVVVAGLRAVEAAQPLDRVVRRHRAFERTGDEVRRDLLEVVLGDAVGFDAKRRVANRGPAANRIEPRGEVAVASDRLGQVDGADDLLERRQPRPGGGRNRNRHLVCCRRCPPLEKLAGLGVNRGRIAAIFLVELEDVASIQTCELLPAGHDLYDFNPWG